MKKTAALFASFAMTAMLVGCASSGASGNIDEVAGRLRGVDFRQLRPAGSGGIINIKEGQKEQ